MRWQKTHGTEPLSETIVEALVLYDLKRLTKVMGLQKPGGLLSVELKVPCWVEEKIWRGGKGLDRHSFSRDIGIFSYDSLDVGR